MTLDVHAPHTTVPHSSEERSWGAGSDRGCWTRVAHPSSRTLVRDTELPHATDMRNSCPSERQEMLWGTVAG